MHGVSWGTANAKVAKDAKVRKGRLLGHEVFGAEGVGEESADGGLLGFAVFAGVEEEGVVVAELGEGLAAGAAGHGGCTVEVRHRYGSQPDAGAVLGDGAGDGTLLGAAGESVGGVLDVRSGYDGAGFEEKGSADAELAVGRVGVLGGGGGEGDEVGAFGLGEF